MQQHDIFCKEKDDNSDDNKNEDKEEDNHNHNYLDWMFGKK